jgi:hypothetical protein
MHDFADTMQIKGRKCMISAEFRAFSADSASILAVRRALATFLSARGACVWPLRANLGSARISDPYRLLTVSSLLEGKPRKKPA